MRDLRSMLVSKILILCFHLYSLHAALLRPRFAAGVCVWDVDLSVVFPDAATTAPVYCHSGDADRGGDTHHEGNTLVACFVAATAAHKSSAPCFAECSA